MPLPQAKPDKRIYELLKNVDLENLTFDDLQAVGQKIFAEQGAEDELRRLVLVNLARLSVAGEWTGLTAAGSGGLNSWGVKPLEVYTGSAGYQNMFIPGTVFTSNMNTTSTNPAGMYLYPFMASDNLTIDAFQLYAGNTNGTTTKIGVYNSLDNGLPDTLQVSCDISHSTTGLLTQTSLTGSLTLTKGETYWLAYIIDTASQQIAGYRYTYNSMLVPFPQTQVAVGYTEGILYDASPTSLPATFDPTQFDAVNAYFLAIGMRLTT